MITRSIGRFSALRPVVLLAVAVAAFASVAATASAHHRRTAVRHHRRHHGRHHAVRSTGSSGLAFTSFSSTSGNGSMSFDAMFANAKISPFAGSQCANTGTPNKIPRYRGTLTVASTSSLGIPAAGVGSNVAKITSPTPPSSSYSLVQCELLGPNHPLPIGQTEYYGLMVYVPAGWSIPNHYFGGTNLEEFQFQGVYGAPVTWQLHGNESSKGPHVTLALETGGCQPLVRNQYGAAVGGGGCQYRSNADNSSCTNNASTTCLPGYYVIPPKGVSGSPGFVEGKWNELVMGVTWSASGGSIQTWYKVQGATTWNQGDTVSGIPTLQWPTSTTSGGPGSSGGPSGNALNITESYTGAVTSPMSLYLDNDLVGSGLAAVEAAMP